MTVTFVMIDLIFLRLSSQEPEIHVISIDGGLEISETHSGA